MKLKQLLIPFLAFSFVVSSCSTSSEPAADSEEVDTTYYFIFGNNMDTKAHFAYKNDYFRVPATTFDKDFALMSFVASANSGQKKEMKKFYDAIHFNKQYYTSVYDTGSGDNTYGFYLASREIDDFTLLALSFRSYDYTQEWVSNVTLGSSGNHEGFEYAVDNAMVEFKSLVDKYYAGKNLKLWVNGFSRGGAEANMFATKIINENAYGFNTDNVYCYTFEAPAPFSLENVHKDYKNIFNLANSGDVVVNVPPEEYGLYRSGIDIDILRDDFDSLYATYMKELYPEPVEDPDTGEMVDKAQEYIDMIPAFKTTKRYANESEFMDAFIAKILAADDPTYGIQDREHYVLHLQTAARFMTKLFFSIDQFAMYYILNDFQSKYLDTPAHMLKLASKLLEEGGLYEVISPYLDYVDYQYSDDELKETCNTLYNVLMHIDFGDLMSLAGALNNIQRALYFHWHESNYVLIRALEYTQEQGRNKNE